MVSDTPDKPLTADADDIPAEHRIRGIEERPHMLDARGHAAVRAAPRLQAGRRPPRARGLRGQARCAWPQDRTPEQRHARRRPNTWRSAVARRTRRRSGATTRTWARRGRACSTATSSTPCYSMSPGGRIEMCTSGPGFQLDEKLEDLGNRLSLSPRTEPLRGKLERELVTIVNPRPRGKAAKAAKGGKKAIKAASRSQGRRRRYRRRRTARSPSRHELDLTRRARRSPEPAPAVRTSPCSATPSGF